MANMNSWNVTDSNGMSHSISCKAKVSAVRKLKWIRIHIV